MGGLVWSLAQYSADLVEVDDRVIDLEERLLLRRGYVEHGGPGTLSGHAPDCGRLDAPHVASPRCASCIPYSDTPMNGVVSAVLGPSPPSPEPLWFVARLPLDVAADRWSLILGRFLAGEHRVECGA